MFTRRSLFGAVAGLFGARKIAPAVTRLDVLYGLKAKPEFVFKAPITGAELVTEALQLIGTLLPGEFPAKDDLDFVLRNLSRMLGTNLSAETTLFLSLRHQRTVIRDLAVEVMPAYGIAVGTGYWPTT